MVQKGSRFCKALLACCLALVLTMGVCASLLVSLQKTNLQTVANRALDARAGTRKSGDEGLQGISAYGQDWGKEGVSPEDAKRAVNLSTDDQTLRVREDAYEAEITKTVVNPNRLTKSAVARQDDVQAPKERQQSIQSTVNCGDQVETPRGWAFAQGTLQFELSNGEMQPLKYTRVELWDENKILPNWLIAETYTDRYGGYSFVFESEQDLLIDTGADIFIMIYAESSTIKVSGILENLLTTYAVYTETIYNIDAGKTYTINARVSYAKKQSEADPIVEDMWHNAFYVEQGMLVGERFAIQVEGVHPQKSKLKVLYPFDYGSTSFCYGHKDVATILWALKETLKQLFPSLWLALEAANALGIIDTDNINGIAGINKDKFDQWDTLTHEYGHYVEGQSGNYGIGLFDLIKHSKEFGHFSEQDHFVDKTDKTFAMKLAWSEAWATAFAFIAQDFNKNEYTNVPDAGDTKYSDSVMRIGSGEEDTFVDNYEDYTFVGQYTNYYGKKSSSGESQEDATIAALWDLFDGGVEQFDHLELGYWAWWRVTAEGAFQVYKGIFTWTDFIYNFQVWYPKQDYLLGEILSAHQIAPGNLSVPQNSVWYDSPPTLTFDRGGSYYNGNSFFMLVVYNYKYEKVYASSMGTLPPQEDGDRKIVFPIEFEEWGYISRLIGQDRRGFLAVEGYCDTALPISGGFISQCVQVNIGQKYLNLRTEGYVEEFADIKAGGYCEYNLKFDTPGARTIQTFGALDTQLTLLANNGDILLQNDESGDGHNAFLSYEFVADVEYRVRVELFDLSGSGRAKIVMTPNMAFYAYTGIQLLNYRGFYIEGVQLSLGRAILYRVRLAADGVVDLRVETDLGIMVYWIDPRSVERTTSNPNADNTISYGDGTQARINKMVQSGVEYFVVVTAYNVQTTTGFYNLGLY